jgi:hypothetical protein
VRWILALVFALAGPAVAQDDGAEAPLAVSSAADVVKAVEAKASEGEILAAIKASSTQWRPKDVFELIDKRVPASVSKGLATQLGLYWEDWFRPLDDIVADARKFGEPRTLTLNDGNLVTLFEWFNDIKYEKDAAVKVAGSLAPKGSSELDREYDVRKRKHQVEVAKAAGKPEGKVEALTVEFGLTAEWDPYDARRGCGAAKLHRVINEVDFFVFRETLGSLGSVAEAEVKSRSVESFKFAADSDRRIEARSFPVCTSESSYAGMAARPVKLEASLKRTYDGKWTGRGEFTSGGNRIAAQQ